VAVRRFQSAFAAVEGLADRERQLLLEEVANWLLRHMPNVPSEEPMTAGTGDIETSEADVDPPSSRDDDSPEGA
jgi:hypothetical protein